jgi:hypothetical protein
MTRFHGTFLAAASAFSTQAGIPHSFRDRGWRGDPISTAAVIVSASKSPPAPRESLIGGVLVYRRTGSAGSKLVEQPEQR